MNIKRIVTGLLTAMALLWATAAYAVDNATEFGIEDDLTVLGTGGTAVDPDAEIKGFTVFGATNAALNIPAAPGSIYARGYVEVSSGMYVAGGSTFTVGAYFTGVSSYSDVANVHYAGGTANQVLKKVAGGGMVWANDNTGLTSLGTPYRLQMVDSGGTGLVDSMFLQNAGSTNITMLATSSMTVLGAFGAGGAATVGGTLGVTGAATLSNNLSVSGITSLNGAINLGDAAADLLTMNAQATFIGGSTFTTGGAYFTGVSSFSNVANIHVAGGTANQVLKKVAGGGMVWGDDNTGLTSLGSARRLQMVNDAGTGLVDSMFLQNASDTNITMLATSSMTVLGAFGAGGAATLGNNLTVADNAQLGNSTSDTHAINKAVEAGVALSVDSGGTSGNYAAKFYSGGSLAAWIKKK